MVEDSDVSTDANLCGQISHISYVPPSPTLFPMKQFALILLLPFALACGGDDESNDNYSTAGDVSGIDSPSINLTGANCLIGNWEMDIATSYNMDALNAMMAQEDIAFQAELEGTDGTISMTLNPDGSAESTMDNAVITVNANSPLGEMTVINTMNGTASGSYSVAGDTLNFFGGGDGSMTTNTQVMMGDQQVSNSSSDQDSVFDSSSETTTMTYECTGDVLTIDVSDSAVSEAPVFVDMRFTRS